MITGEGGAGTQVDAPNDAASAGRTLLEGLLSRPWGQVSPSIYETGRLVALAPWLAGHGRRVRYLMESQRADGMWGAPDGYALVPTLSSVDALSSVLLAGRPVGPHGGEEADIAGAAAALARVLPGLAGYLRRLPASAVPDMPAGDLIAGSLVESINTRLGALAASAGPGLAPSALGARLALPAGMDASRLDKVRAALAAGVTLPEKVLHALEVADGLARGARSVRPASTGAVGASPAATAAWLDARTARDPRHPARVFLETVVSDHDGLAPCGIPITVFERAWVLSFLARAGLAARVPAPLVNVLDAALGPVGTPAAEGLPADADTTAATLYALGLLGFPRPPDVLWTYETGTHFCTWPGEEGFSVTVNAHVLEAFGLYLRAVERGEVPRTAASPRYAATVAKLVTLICERQEADGSWTDRWHASPYYATMCCALALGHFGGPEAAGALRRARTWVRETQRADGSWGRWSGTPEETAYAIHILLSGEPGTETVQETKRYEESVTSGRIFLPRPDQLVNGHIDGPALWHDKDLYAPSAIIRAAVLAAHRLANPHL